MNQEEISQEIERLSIELQETKRSIDDIADVLRYQNHRMSIPVTNEEKSAIESVVIYPVAIRLKNTDAATAANYGVFFIADRAYNIIQVTEAHGTAGSDAGAVTLQLEHLTGTTAPDSGTELLVSSINLKGTANTVVYPTVKSNSLQRGDRLCLKDAGTLTAVANVVVTIYLRAL